LIARQTVKRWLTDDRDNLDEMSSIVFENPYSAGHRRLVEYAGLFAVGPENIKHEWYAIRDEMFRYSVI
jgi:hypothetical protein